METESFSQDDLLNMHNADNTLYLVRGCRMVV